ncbi:Short chain dehydrogenase citE [Lachnellula suecica]|uniref:Short chain dehydrogenase citE n=1 Tax=Lachnellula suecica TaxID=602035 RepID=A0A8T9C6D9_9HELO|nr:Short chain dehydrogenase citE [Lachnellula suecica]
MSESPSIYTLGTHHDVYPTIDPRTDPALSTSLSGKNAVITGSGRGIGRSIALFFAHAAVKSLTLVALEQNELDETAKQCLAINPSLLILTKAFNVTDATAVEQLMEEVEERFGGCDILACNAGRPPQWLETAESDAGIWWDTVATSLQHSFLFTRFALPGMRKRKGGSIIYTSSSGAHATQGIGSYTIGKLGQVRLAEIIHNENFQKYNIKCFAFNPGAVKTRFFTDFDDKIKGKQLPDRSYIEDGVDGQDKSAKTAIDLFKDATFDTPELLAGFVTILASGSLDFMSGRYLDARIDVGDYVKDKEVILSEDLYKVKLQMPGGLKL